MKRSLSREVRAEIMFPDGSRDAVIPPFAVALGARHAKGSRAGKWQSRRNAVRHGLTAETVVATLEDSEDYRGFEAAIIADYDAQTAVERELVLRLASLLWRIRRATAVETDLLQIQAAIAARSATLPRKPIRSRIAKSTACSR